MSVGLFITRAQPFHNGHATIIERMVKENSRNIILIGSATAERNERNPYTYTERRNAIYSWISSKELPRTYILGLIDFPGNDAAWIREVKIRLAAVPGDSVKMYGHRKPDTNYFDWFPEYEFVDTGIHRVGPSCHDLSGTTIRELVAMNAYYTTALSVPKSSFQMIMNREWEKANG